MSTQLHGIGECLTRLEKIAEECGEKQAQAVEKDEFLRVKQRLYVLLEETRDHIHERSTLLKRRGNCHETITKGHSIRQNLDEMRKCLPRLQELHRKAQNKRGAAKRKEELQARYKDIRILKRHVDEVSVGGLTSRLIGSQSSWMSTEHRAEGVVKRRATILKLASFAPWALGPRISAAVSRYAGCADVRQNPFAGMDCSLRQDHSRRGFCQEAAQLALCGGVDSRGGGVGLGPRYWSDLQTCV